MLRAATGRRAAVAMALGLATFFGASVAWASGGEESRSVIENIAVCLVSAAALGLAMKLLRQPLILGYILAGVAIGPVGLAVIADHSEIITLAEIGLILLLFMIGLEIDLKKMAAAGRWVIVPGIVQFPLCVAGGYAAFAALEHWGIDVGVGSYARIYAAVAISLSSTMIVVKLLFDRMELDTLPGRITVGILVFQDIWAIIVLAIQPNLNHPEVLGLARTFGAGAVLVGLALAASRWILPPVFKRIAQVPELVLVLSLGWCFLVALIAAHPRVGLSMEMGALIAGISLATFPYNLDVVAKAISVRDFFITLFFVALGMQIPMPTVDVIISASAIAAVAVLVRFMGVFGVLVPLRAGHRVSFLATVNLAQVSEFSLVILTLGIGFGHIDTDTLTPLIWVFSVLAVTSTYLVTYGHDLQRLAARALEAIGAKTLGGAAEVSTQETHRPLVLLGFYRVADAMVDNLRRERPELLKQIKVIDFNPQTRERLAPLGVAVVYGDISHAGTLHHADVHHAKVVACTIPDSFLKGTTNAKLLVQLRSLASGVRVVVTAETLAQARALYAAGADYVLEPHGVAGDWVATIVESALRDDLPRLRELADRGLAARREIVA